MVGAEIEASLTAINAAEIEIWKISQKDALTFRFYVEANTLHKLQSLCAKRGDLLRVCKKTGVLWNLRAMKRRPVFMLLVAFLTAISILLPGRLLLIRVEGNVSVPTQKILETAREQGIYFGALRKSIRSEKVKNALLENIPQLQWVGVNSSGCRAVISVKEEEKANSEIPESIGASIVASRDGYILYGTTLQGTQLYQPGQTVQEGQTLISAYTDCGLHIRAEEAKGEVFAQTKRNLKVILPVSYRKEITKKDMIRQYSIILRKKRINFWKDSGIIDTTCDRMYEEYYITLPGGFRLPVVICVESFIPCQFSPSLISKGEAESVLPDFAQRYLMDNMVAGLIHSRKESVSTAENYAVLDGEYTCIEMIGRVQREQMGERNVKTG